VRDAEDGFPAVAGQVADASGVQLNRLVRDDPALVIAEQATSL